MEKLTAKQEMVLKELKKYMAKNGYPPTVRELCDSTNLNSTATIQVHLDKLQEKGYIKKNHAKNRTIELLVTNEYLKTKDNAAQKIPFLRKPKAKNIIKQLENPNDFLEVPQMFLSKKHETIAISISPKNVQSIEISDKDIVFIEKDKTFKDGQLMMAINHKNELIINRFYKKDNHFYIKKETKVAESILLDQITIIGKVIGVYCKF